MTDQETVLQYLTANLTGRRTAAGAGETSQTAAATLAAALADLIHSGKLAPGDHLPTQDTLVLASGLSVTTVRAALERLQNQGLVISRPREHTEVLDARPIEYHLLDRITTSSRAGGLTLAQQDCERSGLVPVSRVRVYKTYADDRLASLFESPVGTTLLVRESLLLAGKTADDAVPYQWVHAMFLNSVVPVDNPMRNEDAGPGGHYSRLEEMGFVLKHTHFISVRQPTAREATVLDLPASCPVHDLLRIETDEDTGRVIGVNQNVINPRVTIVVSGVITEPEHVKR